LKYSSYFSGILFPDRLPEIGIFGKGFTCTCIYIKTGFLFRYYEMKILKKKIE